eukprot:TRINITY_DN1226_c0_g2_i1.p1 TRINITY_DN1226_c0_g2~~TRINITY_DN1226_c0_g2_i1.p1  ORF type:complete len:239 (+),score=76.30 TRINITY_DN1226_c0_g2_i1:117-833(+)
MSDFAINISNIPLFNLKINTNENELIGDLLEKIKEHENYQIEKDNLVPVLIYKGNKLIHEKNLKDYKIKENDYLILHFRKTVKNKGKEPSRIQNDIYENNNNNINNNNNNNQSPINIQALARNLLGSFEEQFGQNPNQIPSPVQNQAPIQNNNINQQNYSLNDRTRQILDTNIQKVEIIVSAGFSKERAEKALLLNYLNEERAIGWLCDNVNDPQIDFPLTEGQMYEIINTLQQLGVV